MSLGFLFETLSIGHNLPTLLKKQMLQIWIWPLNLHQRLTFVKVSAIFYWLISIFGDQRWTTNEQIRRKMMKWLKKFLNRALKNLIFMFQRGKVGKDHYHRKTIRSVGNKSREKILSQESSVVNIRFQKLQIISTIFMEMERMEQIFRRLFQRRRRHQLPNTSG